MEHKEITKYHIYRPGEVRWEDVVPEVHEFHCYVPAELQAKQPTIRADGKKTKRVKPKKLVTKKVMTPWGDEKDEQVEETDNDADSIEVTDNEDEEVEDEEEGEEDGGWLVEGESAGVDEDEESEAPAVDESAPAETETQSEEPQEEVTVEEPDVEEVEPEPEPESDPWPIEEEIQPVEEEKIVEEEAPPPPAPVEEPAPPAEPEFEPIWEIIEEDPTDEYGAPLEEEDEIVEEEQEPEKKGPVVEHPIILRKPKFYITDFQMRRKFFMVNKLIDIVQLKGTTLRMQSISASIGPVTCEWKHNGRVIHAPTARKTIEFYTRKNQSILEIENTRVLDSGTYTCTHYNNYTEPLVDSCKVTITVPQVPERADQPPTFTRLLTGTCHNGHYTRKLAKIPIYSTHPRS